MTAAQTSGALILQPDPALAIEKYRRHASGYDASARRTMALRRRVVALLGLAPGETVLDVACGTGLSLPLLRDGVGPSGRVIGIEVSPEMIALARDRVTAAGLDNVELIQAPMESADPGVPLDAILFNYTHDVLQSPLALERIFARARPRARVAIAGIKHASRWLFPLRLYRVMKAKPYVTTLDGLDAPWRLLQAYVPDLRIQPVLLGTNYLARGTALGA